MQMALQALGRTRPSRKANSAPTAAEPANSPPRRRARLSPQPRTPNRWAHSGTWEGNRETHNAGKGVSEAPDRYPTPFIPTFSQSKARHWRTLSIHCPSASGFITTTSHPLLKLGSKSLAASRKSRLTRLRAIAPRRPPDTLKASLTSPSAGRKRAQASACRARSPRLKRSSVSLRPSRFLFGSNLPRLPTNPLPLFLPPTPEHVLSPGRAHSGPETVRSLPMSNLRLKSALQLFPPETSIISLRAIRGNVPPEAGKLRQWRERGRSWFPRRKSCRWR